MDKKENIEKILNKTDEKILAKAIKELLNKEKGNKNGNKKK